jgi:biofilm PGA synthesis N-glycosyltransferase PgaC
MIDVSVGIMAHNEEKSISSLIRGIQKQKLTRFKIKEIIIISSSYDHTNMIINSIKDKRIHLIKEKKREGKAAAINKFLSTATSSLVILESADTVPEQGCYENLLLPLMDNKVGMTNGRPIPLGSQESGWDYVGKLIWKMHHSINLRYPKVGELIAFRRIIPKIDPTAVDEEAIASIFKSMGYKIAYSKDAIVKNHAPGSLKDFIAQRRRIFCGHLQLRKAAGKHGTVPTLRTISVMKVFIRCSNPWKIWSNMLALVAEATSRGLGYYDFLRRRDRTIWPMIQSTKDLGSS